MTTEIVNKPDWQSYQISRPKKALFTFIDYFWEGDFKGEKTPDRLLPHIGFTLLFNLGKPFILFRNGESYYIKEDTIYPRQFCWEDYNKEIHAFGIKFNFSFIPFVSDCPQYALADKPIVCYKFLDWSFIEQIHKASCYEERVFLSENHFLTLFEKHKNSIRRYQVVLDVLNEMTNGNLMEFNVSQKSLELFTSSKSLNRYFLKCVGMAPKQVHRILRLRAALDSYFNNPGQFNFYGAGYYDHSHFYKEVRKITTIKLPRLRVA
jgi:hypothetical protein